MRQGRAPSVYRCTASANRLLQQTVLKLRFHERARLEAVRAANDTGNASFSQKTRTIHHFNSSLSPEIVDHSPFVKNGASSSLLALRTILVTIQINPPAHFFYGCKRSEGNLPTNKVSEGLTVHVGGVHRAYCTETKLDLILILFRAKWTRTDPKSCADESSFY